LGRTHGFSGNARRRPLTTSGLAYILEGHFEAAKNKHPVLRKWKITPHGCDIPAPAPYFNRALIS
jgi:hypothetical protein